MRNAALLIALSLLVVGCVDVGVQQKLYRDNTVDMSISFGGDAHVLSGFTNITINPLIIDTYTYLHNDTNVVYSFKRIPSGTKLFQMEPGKSTSFFGIEEYTVEKRFSFPYYRYTYTLLPSKSLPVDQSPQAKTMMSAIKIGYTVDTFGSVTETSGTKIDKNTVQFTIDATSETAYTIEFKDFFLSDWFG